MNSKNMPFIIGVEGIIGAGKTTFINECLVKLFSSRGYNVKVVREPVDLWTEILPLFYENPERWGYFFQTKALTDRINVITNVMNDESIKPTDIIICERGIVSDHIFMETMKHQSKISDMEYTTYKSLWDIVVKTVKQCIPNLFIYLRPTINESMKRVRNRNRHGEQDLKIEYQEILQKKHDNVFNKFFILMDDNKIPVLKIETDSNFRDDMDVKIELADTVEKCIYSVVADKA